jgi:hypothetical protein
MSSRSSFRGGICGQAPPLQHKGRRGRPASWDPNTDATNHYRSVTLLGAGGPPGPSPAGTAPSNPRCLRWGPRPGCPHHRLQRRTQGSRLRAEARPPWPAGQLHPSRPRQRPRPRHRTPQIPGLDRRRLTDEGGAQQDVGVASYAESVPTEEGPTGDWPPSPASVSTAPACSTSTVRASTGASMTACPPRPRPGQRCTPTTTSTAAIWSAGRRRVGRHPRRGPGRLSPLRLFRRLLEVTRRRPR